MGVIVSQYTGTCRQCGQRHHVGEKVNWTSGVKGVQCLDCMANGMTARGTPQPQPNTWGAQTRAGKSFWQSHGPLIGRQPITFKGVPIFGSPTGRAFTPSKPPPPPPPRQAPTAISQNTLALAALASLEALIMEMATVCMTAEMDQAWSKYQKLKALALNPGTAGEERAALKQAVLHAVKLAF